MSQATETHRGEFHGLGSHAWNLFGCLGVALARWCRLIAAPVINRQHGIQTGNNSILSREGGSILTRLLMHTRLLLTEVGQNVVHVHPLTGCLGIYTEKAQDTAQALTAASLTSSLRPN
jgi:hypothetical protein